MHISARDARRGYWLSFSEPTEVLTAWRLDEVRQVVSRADAASRMGSWVAGYISYEAAPAFDSALETRTPGALPLAVFGLYPAPSRDDLLSWSPGESSVLNQTRSVSREQFMFGVRRVRDRIREGDTYQTNLTYRVSADFTGSARALFQRLICAQAATYGFYLETDEIAICSASPELFFTSDGTTIQSRPMKGTLGRDLPFERLTQSEKESAENLMILDMVRNDISRISTPGSVRVPRLQTLESYPTVWQLTSTAEGLSSARWPRILDAMFPAASITGAPKARTSSIIRQLETTRRGIYTGAMGFVDPEGYSQFNVAIRTAVVNLKRKRLEFGVGGGIVWDSDPANEWEETRVKSAILDYQLPEFSLLETLKWDVLGGFFLEELHLDRLSESAQFFGFDFSLDDVRAELHSALCGHDRPMRVRLLLDRSGETTVQAKPLTIEQGQIRVALSPGALSSANPFLRHKTTHRQVYQQALADCPDADDVILWNERSELTESCLANLFVEIEGELFTPPAYCGLLPGTLRAALLASGAAQERVLFAEDLIPGAVKLGNSVRGLYEVSVLDAPRVE